MISSTLDYFSYSIDHIPTNYAKIKEFQELAKIYDAECEKIEEEALRVFNNRFIMSMDEDACTKWEKILGITVNSDFTIEDRRFNILAKYVGSRPYTLRKLESMLTELVGDDGYKINIDYYKKHIEIKLALGVKNQRYAMKDILENVIPMIFTININLLYNTHELVSRFTHEELAKLRHVDIREEVIDE